MAGAADEMRDALAQCSIAPPSLPVMSNVRAEVYPDDPDQIREHLVAQVTSPVLWVDSMASLVADGHKLFIEVGPGKVLAGLMRDINRESKVLKLHEPDDLSVIQASLD